MSDPQISGHGGHHIVSAAQAYGATTLFTLSGAHIFPLYDAAVGGKQGFDAAPDRQSAERDGAVRLLDVRHEATAVFAAEATGRLNRTPGFAAVTAGPGRDQRRVRAGDRAVQRCPDGRGRWARTGGALGLRVACRSSTTRRCSVRSRRPRGR